MPIPKNATTLFADANVCNDHTIRELELLLSICETMTLRTPLNDVLRTLEIHYDTIPVLLLSQCAEAQSS